MKSIRKTALILGAASLIFGAVSCAASSSADEEKKDIENTKPADKDPEKPGSPETEQKNPEPEPDYLVPSKLTFTSDFAMENEDTIPVTFTVSCDGTQWKTDYSAFLIPDEKGEIIPDETTDQTYTWRNGNTLYVDFSEIIFTIDLANKTYSTVMHQADVKDCFLNPVFEYTTYRNADDTEGTTVNLAMTAKDAEIKPAIVDISFKLFDESYSMKIDFDNPSTEGYYPLIEFNGITGDALEDCTVPEISKGSGIITFLGIFKETIHSKDENGEQKEEILTTEDVPYELHMDGSEFWIIFPANSPDTDMFENVTDFAVSVGDFVLPVTLVNQK